MNEEVKKIHHKLAVDCFNATWGLIDKKDRSREDDANMIHTAHASRYHWGEIGTPLEFQRGEWQISRVYSILEQGEAALFHAELCHDICTKNKIGDFDMAFACEAMARAHSIMGNTIKKDIFIEMTKSASEDIEDAGNKEYLLGELTSIG